MSEKNKIFIYAGPGASDVSLKHTIHTLTSLLGAHYIIQKITPLQIIQDEWEETASLFVMPGGSDLLYLKCLKIKGNDRIRTYVEEGGAYLGLCAGAYYAGQSVHFALNTPLEVVGARALNFFPGIVEGPILANYDYDSYSGARIAHLHWEIGEHFPKSSVIDAFYNGGGYFVEAHAKQNTIVLANYKTAFGFKPAIVEVCHGKGKVVLSGVHWEYDPSLLDPKNPYLKNIIPKLQECHAQTIELSKHLLARLGLRFAK